MFEVIPTNITLNKRWFVLRHGHSEANEQGIIASQMGTAGDAFGLTQAGKREVVNSVELQRDLLLSGDTPLLLSSPLLRTRQTADIAGKILSVSPAIDDRLRERDFGELELLKDSFYPKVWAQDASEPQRSDWQVETVYQVMKRTCELVEEIECTVKANTCIIATHCDTAMILSCAIQGLDPKFHRSLSPLETGELRRLRSSPSS